MDGNNKEQIKIHAEVYYWTQIWNRKIRKCEYDI